ncbi:MAG TPA: META domain-containing protein [Candidatus Sphingobacterium stercoripullorum]|uniref:META domain-containing protein n=1 Tax=Candidatus Sphingobacterium stercoripullorum TaxID=2838759 RepID=A0A9D2AZX0_9SPHI|nr:META domain-containing protein [Candidatus Sphingobacterium stercoripullorum]HLR51118.1 META domain-containing protein [Candidatus Sphingobacterium stercoripullorum]
MKKAFILLAIGSFFMACNNPNTSSESEEQNNIPTDPILEEEIVDLTGEVKLDGNTWSLTEVNEKTVEVSDEFPAKPFLEFTEEGEVFGNAGCNNINGRYSVKEEQTIEFSQMATTQMACPNLELEGEFLKALGDVVQYEIQGQSLVLSNKDGQEVAKLTLKPSEE